MKKLISLLLAAVLAFTAAFTALAAFNGDVDANGKFSAADARKILRAAVHLEDLTPEEALLADVDMNGSVAAADARVALRLAVKLEVSGQTRCENEYDVLRSGTFLADVAIRMGAAEYGFTIAAGKDFNYMEMKISDIISLLLYSEGAADPESVKQTLAPALAEIDQNQTFAMLFRPNGFYLIDPTTATYADLGSMMGASEEDLGSITEGMFDVLPALSDADDVSQSTFRGKACTEYAFKEADGVLSVFMSGKKLLAIVNYDTAGKETMTFLFNRVSLAIPAEYTNVASYKKDDSAPVLEDVFGTMMAISLVAG